ncbi:hypothetical protein JCGZ_01959 [Jatropha curcas]|uniref:IST1-like protein n=1 Tax=Jatropha curcas TaxID=180498 RepID=A0A067JSA2_JATCU|nr:IST1-like protein [Jatropha curcas]XP_012089678.1 IST1-like protein [Jatropha curcas]KDP22885.1 hypothetical protein JCGZ_01959 [Jatropha curcas]
MSMLDSFFNKGFKAAKCKTLLKLTIPRIKLLRNRREIQIKQMRRDIAKLLETGQEATARIRVEHIIREENMMAAQEILELFCELISVRLPIIEAQRECPLDLKEAISSICFAAPRCADLPELLQVQMLFASKYGKEFVAAASELMPECGVNRQLIELLSIRAPSPEVKLKLLKEIAEEHELDWDPAASETELLKPHEDLLNGPTQFVSGSKLPLPKEKHDEELTSIPDNAHDKQPESDSDFDELDFPEVPKVSLRPTANAASAPEMETIPATAQRGIDNESSNSPTSYENLAPETHLEDEDLIKEKPVAAKEEKQFLPFMSPPSASPASISTRLNNLSHVSRTKSEANVDLLDVVAAAQAAAETAERAAAAARSAATLAQAKISELTKKNSEKFPDDDENPFHTDIPAQSATKEKPHFDHQPSFGDRNGVSSYLGSHQLFEGHQPPELHELPSFEKLKVDYDSASVQGPGQGSVHHQPQRLPSMDDESYFSYPNLFTTQNPNVGLNAQSVTDNSHSTHGV